MPMRTSRAFFALAMVGFGIVGLIYGVSVGAPVPKALPAQPAIIAIGSIIEIACGIGLLTNALRTFSVRLLLPFLLLWLGSLKLRFVVLNPLVEVNWESLGETLVLSAGAWCLFAAHAGGSEKRFIKFAAGENGIRAARLLFIAALPMFGLSHFLYAHFTATLVPTWLGFPLGWTYLTGAASLAAATGMLLAIMPRLAATLEALMLWGFTLLVWVPRLASAPANEGNWSEFVTSWAIASGAWLVADTYRNVPLLASGKPARAISLD